MRVIWKLGGSVLAHRSLRTRLGEWSRLWPESQAAWLPGGGAAADAVREWDERHRLGDERSHHLALAAMDFNAELLAALLPQARSVRSERQCELAWQDGQQAVLCASCVAAWAEQTRGETLPRTWELTSDAIAAWLARPLGADRLVLVKSIPPPGDLAAAAAQGYIDRWFARFATGGLSVWTVTPDEPAPRIWMEGIPPV